MCVCVKGEGGGFLAERGGAEKTTGNEAEMAKTDQCLVGGVVPLCHLPSPLHHVFRF